MCRRDRHWVHGHRSRRFPRPRQWSPEAPWRVRSAGGLSKCGLLVPWMLRKVVARVRQGVHTAVCRLLPLRPRLVRLHRLLRVPCRTPLVHQQRALPLPPPAH